MVLSDCNEICRIKGHIFINIPRDVSKNSNLEVGQVEKCSFEVRGIAHL